MTINAARIASRRAVLRHTLGGAAALAGLALVARRAAATPEAAEQLLQKLTGGTTWQEGRVRLDMPEIAENGNTVPLTVSVESPMTADDHVKAVHVVADGNPEAGVATFHFTPMSGRAEVATRMRLAGTQDVIAVAEMSNGEFYAARTNVKVTIGGCGG